MILKDVDDLIDAMDDLSEAPGKAGGRYCRAGGWSG